MGQSIIKFSKNTVTKTSTPELMLIEVEKTRRAYEIGRDCGLFRVPEVLEYDEAAGTAVFERLDIKPVSIAVPWGEKRCTLSKNVGVSLAIIHRELSLPDQMLVPLPSEFSLSHDEVFFHGDLSVDNVCVGNSWPPIVILDWQMTPLYGGQATFGTRYFDILWFINNLINRPSPRFLLGNPVAPVIRVFLESYFQESRLSCNSEMLLKYAIRFFDIEMQRRESQLMQNPMRKARFLWPRGLSIMKNFLKFLETFNPYQ